jgi:hypothetical protein
MRKFSLNVAYMQRLSYLYTIMTTEQALNILFNERAWWKDSGINESSARSYKKRFLEGRLEIETQLKILNSFGFRVVQQMQWEKDLSKEQLYKSLINRLHKEHVFWSYDKSQISQISDDALIEKVLLHLDIDDIKALFKLYPKTKIQRVWKEKMLAQVPLYHGLNRLYAFLLFDIKHPDRYIRDFKNKRYKSIICKV